MGNRRRLIIIAGFIFVLLAAFAIYISLTQSVQSTQYVTISYKNSHDVVIHDISQTQHGGSGGNKPVTSIAHSGETLKLTRNLSYVVSAKGNPGFEDKEVGFVLGDTSKQITIDPYYSAAKLGSMVDSELGNISQALTNKYPNIALYQIQPGKLYHWGNWYGTILTYKGAYNLNADTLRVVLAKENNGWVVKTDPPDITLSKFTYPSVPVDILNDVNNASQFQTTLVDPAEENYSGARLRQ